MRGPARGISGGAAALAAAAIAAVGCVTEETISQEERGEELFRERGAFTDARGSLFACATCHAATTPPRSAAILPGAPLAGVLQRGAYWGGAESDLLTAVEHCRTNFLAASAPLRRDDPKAVALWAYLASLPPTTPAPVPFTVVRAAVDLPPPSDPEAAKKRGEGLYQAACASCHGALHTGAGRLATTVPILPEESVAAHAYLGTITATRGAFLEKIRHGGFLGYGGVMPPFSAETLSDGEVVDLLAALGLYYR